MVKYDKIRKIRKNFHHFNQHRTLFGVKYNALVALDSNFRKKVKSFMWVKKVEYKVGKKLLTRDDKIYNSYSFVCYL